jgi:site-specific recombinase
VTIVLAMFPLLAGLAIIAGLAILGGIRLIETRLQQVVQQLTVIAEALQRSAGSADRHIHLNRQLVEAVKQQHPPIVVSPGSGILS